MTKPVKPREAATVMLVRDGASGIEVFMLKRHIESDFVGGAYVYPGGKVDEADRHADVEEVCEGLSSRAANAKMNVESGAIGVWIAAVRECFEEAGVLLAKDSSGEHVSFSDPAVHKRFSEHKSKVYKGEKRLVDVCREENLVLQLDEIHYFSHWITPPSAPKRFDTHFFVAVAPPEQEALHDDIETVANCWVRPMDAVDMYKNEEMFMVFPTIKHLLLLSEFDTVEALMASAAAKKNFPTMQGRPIFLDDGRIHILLPGDPGYDDVKPPEPGSGIMPKEGQFPKYVLD